MIINRIYEHQNLAVACFLPGRAKDLSATLYNILRVYVCNLSYPTYKAQVPYYIVICGLSGSTIFFRIVS